MIKILYRIPNLNDAVSFYRGLGVLGHLRKMTPIDFVMANDFQWYNFAMVDLLYIVRPATNADVQIIKYALDTNTPVLIDYDDDVLNVPDSNSAHYFYSDPQIQSNIKWIIKHATTVSVSTNYLAQQFNAYRDRQDCVVIRNAFNETLIDWSKPRPKKSNIITWRGSRTHDEDLGLTHEFLLRVLKDHPELSVVFIGEPDYQTTRLFFDRSRIIKSDVIINYFQTFFNLNPLVHIVPLSNHKFNLSKSNIAWIEATWAGAKVLAQRMPEFSQPGVFCVEDWSSLDFDEALRKSSWEHSRDYIENHLLLKIVNKERLALIESIIC